MTNQDRGWTLGVEMLTTAISRRKGQNRIAQILQELRSNEEPVNAQKKTWRILSISGGGIRGIIPMVALVFIEALTGMRIAELFDVIGGTSTGSIPAAGLAIRGADGRPKYSALQFLMFYLVDGIVVFPQNLSRTVMTYLTGGAKYDGVGLQSTLAKYVGDAKLRDLMVPIVITTTEETQGQPVLLTTYDDETKDWSVSDAIRASTAAPTFLPQLVRTDSSGVEKVYGDGGLFANNPAQILFDEAYRFAQPGDEFFMVSLATGSTDYPLVNKASSVNQRRPWQWLAPIAQLFYSLQDKIAAASMERLLNRATGKKMLYQFDTKLQSGEDSIDDASAKNCANLLSIGVRMMTDEQPIASDEVCAKLLNLAVRAQSERQSKFGENPHYGRLSSTE